MAGLDHKLRTALAERRVEPTYVSDAGGYGLSQIGNGQIAPYNGPSHLVFGENTIAPAETAGPAEESRDEDLPAPKGGLARAFQSFGNFLQTFLAGPTRPGEVRTPGRTATADGRPDGTPTGGGIAALIPFEAIKPELASKLKAIFERSEKANHEHSWRVYEKGEVFDQGDIYQNEGRSVATPLVWDKGNLTHDFHTHPRITTFSHGEGDVRPIGSNTNMFSPDDLLSFRVALEMYPGVICAAIAPNGLLLYLDDRPKSVESNRSGEVK